MELGGLGERNEKRTKRGVWIRNPEVTRGRSRRQRGVGRSGGRGRRRVQEKRRGRGGIEREERRAEWGRGGVSVPGCLSNWGTGTPCG